jgi:hypothetical protein
VLLLGADSDGTFVSMAGKASDVRARGLSQKFRLIDGGGDAESLAPGIESSSRFVYDRARRGLLCNSGVTVAWSGS